MTFFLPLVLFFLARVCATEPVFIYHFCLYDKGNFTSNSTFKTNLDHVLSSIATAKYTSNGFYNFSYGQTSDSANAIGLCRGDVKPDTCRSCLNDSIRLLTRRCPRQKEAIGWYDNCMLRYSSRPIFGVMETQPLFFMWATTNVTEKILFREKLETLLDGLKNSASSGGYASGDISGQGLWRIYGLLQCTPDLSRLQCDECLVSAIRVIPPCCREGMRVLFPSCNVRYEMALFFEPLANSPSPLLPPPPPLVYTPSKMGKKFKMQTVITIVLPVVALFILLAIGIYAFLRSRKSRKRLESSNGDISSIDLLQYDFKTVKDATDDFSAANKLGQGGFGVVYKSTYLINTMRYRDFINVGFFHGKLLNGQEVAVKRLAQGSEQGDLEFKNEVLLVAKLQHRNLVRLLGFCFARNERLLVYEFIPNSSLDRFIFDPIKRQYLDWPRRNKIIVGVSRGLVYLHEDSQFKVIHHDLKPSNILLDDEFNPKITDFGMARLCSFNESYGDTSKVKGTYGYMAPEYVMYGHFSVKSDVFSFGVLLLEIVSGQKNSSIQDDDNIEHLLSYAWENWMKGTIAKIIDPILNGGYMDEIMKCIHIGLLCVQDNVASRPTMASVVLMLSSNSFTLPVPSRPGFLLHSNSSNFPPHFNYSEEPPVSESEHLY